MLSKVEQIPPGDSKPYDVSSDFLGWLEAGRAEFGDIYRASAYGSNIYVVNDPDYIQHILRKNWQNYRKGLAIRRVELLLGRGLISSEGEFWKSQRRLIQPAFHHKVIVGLSKVIKDENAALLARWKRAAQCRESVNITNDISAMILELVLTSIFSEDYHKVAPHFSILANVSARDLQFAHAFRPLGKVVAEVADQRRAESRTSMDFLGMLMEARDRDSGHCMSNSQLVTEIMTLIVAGHETTALTLNWTWYLLSQNQHIEAKLAKELSQLHSDEFPDITELPRFSFTGQILDEALRLFPPVWLITRKALRDDHLGDYFVPAGTEIYISPYIMQRHPDRWAEPSRFDPDRFGPDQSRVRHPLAMFPFSAGPRNCIGEALARAEMQMQLIIIGGRLRLRYPNPKALELELGVNLRNKHDFIMFPEVKVAAAA